MREITIAVAQMLSVPGDVSGNLERMERLARECAAQGGELLCLPEASLTGYSRTSAKQIALAPDDPALERAENLARETGIALSFGYIEKTGDEFLPQGKNSSQPFVTHMVTDGTHRLAYRKTHLGPHEQAYFAAGNELPVETVADVRIGISLCWEAHFPQIATALRTQGAELILAPFACSLSGERRRDAWMRVLPARANDNGCFLAACNALRTADNGAISGGGAIVFDWKGAVMAECFSFEKSLVMTKIAGPLPRDATEERMGCASYFDHRRPELYGE